MSPVRALACLAGLMAFALAQPAAALSPLKAPAPLQSPPPQAIETASGLAYVVLEAGPDPGRFAQGRFFEYRLDGWSADGVTRASAAEEGHRITTLPRLLSEQPGLARALMSTPVGETRRWWISADALKPGYLGMPDLPHVFDLTVVGEANPARPPDDLAAPPADAVRTPSGLAYRVLRAGKGEGHPGPRSLITIHYTGWTRDGRAFDSSVLRDQVAEYPLDQLIPGWQEGIRLMRRGDTFRLWIPRELAYGDSIDPRVPAGPLVFDVTLFDFTP